MKHLIRLITDAITTHFVEGIRLQIHTFTFMGTAAGCGVPAFFCDCPACIEARQNPELARGDCGVMLRTYNGSHESRTFAKIEEIGINANNASEALLAIDDPSVSTIMIDTPPDARHQLLREGVKSIDAIIFTHCHFDHIGGLGEYEYLVQLARHGEKIPVYGSAIALQGIFREFEYMDYCMDPHILEDGDTIELAGIKYTALDVAHAPGTFGYLIETPNTKMFYASDTGPLPTSTAQEIYGLDILAMDATYWKKNWNPEVHHSIQECIKEGFDLDAKKIYLTHMCMHYDEPITYMELKDYLSQYGGRVEMAMDGLTLEI